MSRRAIYLSSTLAVIIAGVVVVAGVAERRANVRALAQVAEQQSIAQVATLTAQPGPRTVSFSLPGNVQAWYQAPIYAQVAGYVSQWYVDYGAHVTRGQLLATISTPGLDAQFASAKANLAVAEAKYKLSALTARRFKALSGTQAISQQQVDVEAANATAEQAEVTEAQDNMQRFADLENFRRVVAPFDGIVTARRTDIGDYVDAAGGDMGATGGATELFSVADVHKLRVFVDVPESYAASLKAGLTAEVTLPQFPGKTFSATMMTDANSFVPSSRTVTAEFVIDNNGDEIWPGSFATVELHVPVPQPVLMLLQQAFLFRADGMEVAIVGPDNRVHLQPVTVGRTIGSSIEVLAGLKPSDQVIDNPSEGMLSGQLVAVVKREGGVSGEGQAS